MFNSENVSKPVITGFVLSLILTLVAYALVKGHLLSGWSLGGAILGLGCIQALVQLIFFLHLGIEGKPRWNALLFLFTVLLVIAVVGGSLWIMHNLNYNMMPNMSH